MNNPAPESEIRKVEAKVKEWIQEHQLLEAEYRLTKRRSLRLVIDCLYYKIVIGERWLADQRAAANNRPIGGEPIPATMASRPLAVMA